MVTETIDRLTDNAKVILERRYLSKDREGNVSETPDGMFRRVAHNLSQSELRYGKSEKERMVWEEQFYEVMSRLDFLPNSPTLMNAGRELQQLSACFVLPVADSLEDIFARVKDTALIHKSGGGDWVCVFAAPPRRGFCRFHWRRSIRAGQFYQRI